MAGLTVTGDTNWITNSVIYADTTSSNLCGMTNFYYGNDDFQPEFKAPETPKEPAEIEWLRKRVDEMLWREAA